MRGALPYPGLDNTIADLISNSADNLTFRSLLVILRNVAVATGGGYPAQTVKLLDDQRLCSIARRGKRRPNPGRPTTHYQYIDLVRSHHVVVTFT